jgi:hypothetical protein
MALQNTDLFVLYRPATKVHYNMKASDLTTGGASLPDGTEDGQVLKWDGSDWVASTIDGGSY